MTDNAHIPVPHRKSSQKALGLIRKIYCLLDVSPQSLKGRRSRPRCSHSAPHNAHNTVARNKSHMHMELARAGRIDPDLGTAGSSIPPVLMHS